jgi:hypothetical protein
MCGYGDVASLTASRSKKRACGMREVMKVSWPFRPSLGRNQDAQRVTILGAVESFEWVLFWSAALSSMGVMR